MSDDNDRWGRMLEQAVGYLGDIAGALARRNVEVQADVVTVVELPNRFALRANAGWRCTDLIMTSEGHDVVVAWERPRAREDQGGR